MREQALVTGASSGIGLELARQFVQHGFDVIITAEDDELATAEAALAGDGAEVRAVKADLSTSDGVERLWAAVAGLGRPLDAVALNAGIGVNGDFTRDIPLEDDLRLIAVNVTAVVHLAKRILPGMVDRGEGRVLITSSVAATAPGPYYATYAASKAFLQSFAQAVRHELKDSGVTVTALQPGPTDTEFFDRAGMDDTKVAEAKKDDPAEVAKDGFEALMAGKDHVIAGSVKNKAQVVGGKVLSEKARAATQAAQTKPQADE
ncbi:MAG TPA: SDR family NAD(P)-dependent oxidoreductase [Actinomycetes bacterium]|nr:SDR family NAD(P)-dependent oxidoreductase [Actinomycetes bacterium]